MPALSNDPAWLKAAYKDLGLQEVPGPASSSRVIQMFRLAGHPEVRDDAVAWCSAAANAWMSESGYKGTGSLAARSWLNWGKALPLNKPIPRGAVLIFRRGNSEWQGHVCYLLEDGGSVLKVIGGNQSDSVSIARFGRQKLIGARWPIKAPTPAKAFQVATEYAPTPLHVVPSKVEPPAPSQPDDEHNSPEESDAKQPVWKKVATGVSSVGGVGALGAFTDWHVVLALGVVGVISFLMYWFLLRSK